MVVQTKSYEQCPYANSDFKRQYKNHLVIIIGIFHRWNHGPVLPAQVMKPPTLSFEERISTDQNISLETDPEGQSC